MRQNFERTGDGTAAIRRRSSIVDRTLIELWRRVFQSDPNAKASMLALGGYGRKDLFPFSDIDVLFAFADDDTEKTLRSAIRAIIQAMWDIGLRASPTSRTLKECTRFDPDNLEFTLATFDHRFLAGNFPLYQKLHNETFPGLVLSEWNSIAQKLGEIARARHAKYGNTIFHLEPNIKDCPGGLRDFTLAPWFHLLFHLKEHKEWPRQRSATSTSGDSPSQLGWHSPHGDAEAAFDFLSAARCFLHFRQGRDDNTLNWQAQDDAAANSIGLETRGTADPAYWMRTYYRHARTVYRRAALLMEHLPAPVSFYKQFRKRRAPLAGTDFILDFQSAQGRIDVAPGAQFSETDGLLRVFAAIAHHGYTLTQAAEDRITDTLPVLAIHLPEGPYLWNALREILLGRHAAHALRTMHALGILEMLLPEFHGIDALVIRDSYHRYTVDEHTFLTIENVQSLRRPASEPPLRTTASPPCSPKSTASTSSSSPSSFTTPARPAAPATTPSSASNSPTASSPASTSTLKNARSSASSSACISKCRTPCAAISSTPKTFAASPTKSAAPRLLKMLTLLTYADIKAVNPDALTPWKAENLWQLYMATANFHGSQRRRSPLPRRHRSHPAQPPPLHGPRQPGCQPLGQFLEGLPQRYLQTRLPEHIRNHFLLAANLDQDPVQLELRPARQLFDLTVIARDRSRLFADVAGALAAWGMNIVKADAFSNEAGVIVDSFQFTDVFRTLELNPTEKDRFLQNVHDVVAQGITAARDQIDQLLANRRLGTRIGAVKVEVPTRLEFDSDSSHPLHPAASRRPGRPRPPPPDRPRPHPTMQHRGRPDRHRRRNRHRRLLPHPVHPQAHPRSPIHPRLRPQRIPI